MTDQKQVNNELFGFYNNLFTRDKRSCCSTIKGGLQPLISSACCGSPPATNGVQTTLALVWTFLFINFVCRKLLEVGITWLILFCYKERQVRISQFVTNIADTVLTGVNKTLFKTPNLKNYQPWCNVASDKRTFIADMCVSLAFQEQKSLWPH